MKNGPQFRERYWTEDAKMTPMAKGTDKATLGTSRNGGEPINAPAEARAVRIAGVFVPRSGLTPVQELARLMELAKFD